MKYLLDTCVLSEVMHPQGNPSVKKIAGEMDPGATYLSVITIGEISKGIFKLNEGTRKQQLREILSRLETKFASRILPITVEIANRWGQLTATASRQGYTIGAPDGLIAATALVHDLYVVTRNEKDFESTGVKIINPWALGR